MNKPEEKWIPVKGETVYVFSHKTRRVKEATVKNVIELYGFPEPHGGGAVIIETPFATRATYNMSFVGRTPREALAKTLERSEADLTKKQVLVEFLKQKLLGKKMKQ